MKKIYWIDLFCGAGGTSSGIHFSGDDVEVLACVNHDKNAIESHQLNHPKTHHFTEDIRDFDVVDKINNLVAQVKKREPFAMFNLWASLECTNHSKAKGGQSRDADSRSLANHMEMYLKEIDFDCFYVENVKEFLDWGPLMVKRKLDSTELMSNLILDKKGKYINVPVPHLKGMFYKEWVKSIIKLGYHYDYKVLNAADFGSYQSRDRLFIQFTKLACYIEWPEQTHCKIVTENLFNNHLKQWNSVKTILDLKDEGKSIFERKKPLVDKTLDVIYKGILKALKEKEKIFLYKYYGTGDNYNSINNPAGTVTTKDRFAKIQLIFNQYKTGNTSSIELPSTTVTTTPKQNLLTFILNPSYGGHSTSINRPCPTVVARQDKAPLYLIHVLMEEYGIIDIKMRMLKIPELLQIQGFPKDYKLVGTQTEQKKYIGNAVEVNMAKALIKANTRAILSHLKVA